MPRRQLSDSLDEASPCNSAMNYEGDDHVRMHGTGVSTYGADSQTQQYMFEYAMIRRNGGRTHVRIGMVALLQSRLGWSYS